MPIIAKENASNFKPAPAGVALAVCCDVVDLGMVKTNYQGKESEKHKVKLVWQLAEPDGDYGKRPIVSQRYTLSLHERAVLRRDLESWRGRAFTPDELKGFDVEKVIGVPSLLNIVHNVSKGTTYANVKAIMPVPKGTAPLAVEGYVREQDRPRDEPEDDGGEFHATDDDVPFALFMAPLLGLLSFVA